MIGIEGREDGSARKGVPRTVQRCESETAR